MKKKIEIKNVKECLEKIDKAMLINYENMVLFFPIDTSTTNETNNDVVSMIRPTVTGSSAMVNYGIVLCKDSSVNISAALVDLNTAISVDLSVINQLGGDIDNEITEYDCRVIPANSLLFKI